MLLLPSVSLFLFLFVSSEIVAIQITSRSVANYDYGEKGPDTWWFHFPVQCDNLLFPIQSPIDLNSDATIVVSKIPAIEVSNFDILPRGLSLFNDGTGVTITPSYTNMWPFIQNGPLTPNTKYYLHHMKLHWGGSEHRINNTVKAIMEIQLFLFNKHDYNGFQDALLNNDGVIGLSFLVTENTNGKENSHWKPIFDKIDTIRRAGNVEKIEPIGIQELLPELKDLKQYWMYQGSLTTPPCSNTLKWIISKDFVKMQQSQVESLTALKDAKGKPIMKNIRPLQKINDRKVLKCV